MPSPLLRVGAIGVMLASWGCGGGSSSTSPSPTPNGNATTVNILGQRGAQSYTPNPATVGQGNMVVWHNSDTVAHHIVSNDGSIDTGVIAPGATSPPLPLNVNGTNYHCTIHPTTMNGGAITTSVDTPPPPCQGQYC